MMIAIAIASLVLVVGGEAPTPTSTPASTSTHTTTPTTTTTTTSTSVPAAADASTPASAPASASAPAPASAPASASRRLPRPIRWRVDTFLHATTLTLFDPGYRAFDPDRTLTGVTPGLRVDARVRGPVFLGAGLRYGFARTSRAPYDGALATRLSFHDVQALVRLSIVLLEGIDVVAEVDAGTSFRRMRLDSRERTTETFRVGESFAAKAGIALYLPKAWLAAKGAARATAGIDLLVGYGLRTPVRGSPHPDRADDAIDVAGTPLGDVALHGLAVSIGVFVRVM